jgi:hypothetical protein
MVRWVLVLLGVVAVLSPASAAATAAPHGEAAAASYTIRTSQGYVARIGAFRIRRDPTIRAAVLAFGPMSHRGVQIVNNRGGPDPR